MKNRLIATSAALAVAALVLAAQASYSFKISPKVGDTFKVKTSIEAELQGMQIQQSMVQTEKVTKVDEKGVVTTETVAGENKLTVNGQEMPGGPEDAKETQTKSPWGEILTSEGGGETPIGIARRTSRMGALPTPEKAIAVGDSWSYEFKADKKDEVPASKVTFKLLAEEKAGTRDSLKVEVTFAETEGANPLKATGFIWFDKSAFTPNKVEMSVSNFPLPPGAPVESLNLKLKSERID